jgi:hypothetical protein
VLVINKPLPGLMWEPPTTNSVRRKPQLQQRQRSRTSDTSPRLASFGAARLASRTRRHALHQTCNRRTCGRPSGASGGCRSCGLQRSKEWTQFCAWETDPASAHEFGQN